MSLKAGGVGINLTAASNAFVLVCNEIELSTFNCDMVSCLYEIAESSWHWYISFYKH
jgi:hypothetical protein